MSNTNDQNWVKDILSNATNTVRAWPDWMKRSEVRNALNSPTGTSEKQEADKAAPQKK